MTLQQYLHLDYAALVSAAQKITGNSDLHLDLLHYAIEELSHKPNLQDILDSGGARFYLIRIQMTQWRSQTGPFYRQFVRQHSELASGLQSDEEPISLDQQRIYNLLDGLSWYEKELFLLYADRGLNYSDLARETGIPRTSISLTIRRVKSYLKKNL